MKISERGQVTIPKHFRIQFGLHHEVEIEFVTSEDGLLIRKRASAKHPVDSVRGILQRPSDTDAYISELRGR